MWFRNVGTSFFRFVTDHASGRQTNGQTDREADSFIVTRPPCI